MKNLLFLSMMLISAFSFAQTGESDKIIGSYMTGENKGKVTITKNGDKYSGTLVWTNVPNALDENNPDEKQRKNKIAGKIILKDFVYTGDGTWEKGTVYDPENGKTYNGKITLAKNGNLNMRGFIGFAVFGRTTVWTRVK